VIGKDIRNEMRNVKKGIATQALPHVFDAINKTVDTINKIVAINLSVKEFVITLLSLIEILFVLRYVEILYLAFFERAGAIILSITLLNLLILTSF
tara:strand:+ start:156 stop:443 length:288 start_codon:yes stop_codon:yes gene_type:complete